ncbi:hypothetical protein O181_028361 [Austropuccinia psidii MF-1]|uniref:Uncharacterized protein n=1 Tax=Austropuccinia psidii MF-1 TaxID=1389203 RepID=A0A9Q3CUC7_9BASI|nr:hypothetical protein [Austropuccinia psidii MF-1]
MSVAHVVTHFTISKNQPVRRPPLTYGQIQLRGQRHPRNPQATFISQSILSWIKWFLNIPGVEAKLEQWEHNFSSHEGEVVFDVTQAVVCKRELDQLSSDQSFQLKFELFVDWFNPRGNKPSGKQLSMGLLVLYCLNLQPRERFQPRFSCLAGVIPSPNQPDMITINNILKPTIDELLEIQKVKISTPSHPHGRNVSIKLVALIGDIVATHKVAGFMSHSAKYFCSWCEPQDHSREELILGKPRQKSSVLGASHRWNNARTIKLQQKFAKSSGIRWSELNRLPYWDPVTSVALGIVHNWYEGVLRHHVLHRWGFDINLIQKNVSLEPSESGSDEIMQDNFGSKNDENITIKGYLTQDLIEKIQNQINEIIVPKGISHIPSQIGTPSAGKLKANEWSVLFDIYLPLALLDILWDLGSRNRLLLVDIGALIQCTDIVGATSIKQEDIDLFSKSYETYQHTSKILFPNIRVTPNHHYAMHIPEQLMRWGPLKGISEYGDERLIGILQKFKTNSLIGSVEETIMKKFGQMQRFQQFKAEVEWALPNKDHSSSSNRKALDEPLYIQLLKHLQKELPQLRNYCDLPHPLSSMVLRNSIIEKATISWKFQSNISKFPPNNLIYITNSLGKIEFAKIVHILDLANDKIHKGLIILVSWFEEVKEREEGFNELEAFLEAWKVMHLKEAHRDGYVSFSQISGLGAYLKMPAWSLGCRELSLMARPINKRVGLEAFD